MTGRSAVVSAVLLAGALVACADDPGDATPGPSTTPASASTTANASTAPSGPTTAPGASTTSATAPPGAPTAVPAVLCPTIQAWSDATVDAVNGFRLASRTLDAAGRRARYAEAFADQVAVHDRLAAALARLALPDSVAAPLHDALDVVAVTIADGARQAASLPDDAYATIAVRDGKLLVGTEKSNAVVFNTLADLADDGSTGVPRGCGRRGALDLSPSATFPP